MTSGTSFGYKITATNTGSATATKATVSDPLPASLHYDSVATTQGTCTRTPPPAGTKTQGGTVTCTLGSLGGGNSATVTITVTATTAGTLSDTAAATATNVTSDPDDTATAATTVHGT